MQSSRAMTNYIECPSDYQCTKLHKEIESVCCPLPEQTETMEQIVEERPQSSKFFPKYKTLHNVFSYF